MSTATNDEYRIQVQGGPPPPLPTKGKKKKKAASQKSNSQQQQQQQRRYKMILHPSTSIEQLRKDVYALFNIPTDHIKSYQISFLNGFPPKELDQTDKATVHELGIRTNESITIRFTLADAGSNNDVIATTTTVVQKRFIPKRQAATAANESFKGSIAAQDAFMKKEKKKVPKRKATSTTGNISGFGNTTSTAASKKSKPKKVKMVGSGCRLSDGKTFAGDNQNEEAVALLSTHGEVLDTKLNQAWEQSDARERVIAAGSRKVKFEEMKGGTKIDGGHVLGRKKDYGNDGSGNNDDATSDDDEVLRFKVTYKGLVEGNQQREEEVEIYTIGIVYHTLLHLNETLLLADGKEGDSGREDKRLRPEMLAKKKSLFWSLIFHFTHTDPFNTLGVQTVEDMLLCLLDGASNVSHLDRGGRMKFLSWKAAENAKQGKDKYTYK